MQNKKKMIQTLGSVALIVSVAMYLVGTSDSHLTELADFFWSPLLLAVVCFIAASKMPEGK